MPLSDRLDLRHADVWDVLPQLPDASVDLVVADPPYAIRATRLHRDGPDWDGDDSMAFV